MPAKSIAAHCSEGLFYLFVAGNYDLVTARCALCAACGFLFEGSNDPEGQNARFSSVGDVGKLPQRGACAKIA